MDDKIFERACLMQLTTSVWSASRSVDPVIIQNSGCDWVKGRKHLINPELLGRIKTAAQQARNKTNRFTLPFPINGIALIPKEFIPTIEEILQKQRESFRERIDDFVEIYPEARAEAKEVLGDLFNEADYPLDIRKKFKFEWRFLALTVPTKSTILSPEIYEKEKTRFQKLMSETRSLCMEALRTEFAGLVHEIVKKLNVNTNNPKKIVTNSMYNRLNDFFLQLESKNIFEDQQILNLAEQARAVISNVSPYNLKYNTDIREQIKKEMTSIHKELEESIIDLPRRQIRMENLEAA